MKPPSTHKRMRKKRTAIPVQPPKVPGSGPGFIGGGGGLGIGNSGGTYVSPPEIPLQMYQKMKTAAATAADKQRLIGGGGIGAMDKLMGGGNKSMYPDVHEEESSIDISSPRDNNSPLVGRRTVSPMIMKSYLFFAIPRCSSESCQRASPPSARAKAIARS